MVRAAAVGLLGLGLTGLGGAFDARRALFAYLAAYTFWVGIAAAALVFLMANEAAGSRWYIVVRRILETIPAALVVLAVLFVPIALGMKELYPWVDPSAGGPFPLAPWAHGEAKEAAHLWEHRHAWLNVPFFLFRTVLYLLVLLGAGALMRGWSLKQDDSGDPELTLKMRRLGAGGLPFVALAITFAAVDWQMSLSAFVFSTIFGVYWFSGSLVAALGVLIIAVAAASREEPLRGALNANHVHSLGKYLFAFTAFWAYIAFSQYLLIWIGNLPEEVPWYLVRTDSGWKGVGVFLVLFQFVFPFVILLSRGLKRRLGPLVFLSVWILAAHYVDIYWVVMPPLSPQGPRPSFMDLTALVGVGGVAVSFVVSRLRGHPLVPSRDPHLGDSLRYEPQQ
jgi:hypothetical protein